MTNSKIIQVKVKTNSNRSELVELEDGTFVAHLQSLPIEGKANKELIKLISKYLGLSKSDLEIKTGKTSKVKLVKILIPSSG